MIETIDRLVEKAFGNAPLQRMAAVVSTFAILMAVAVAWLVEYHAA